jgi:hypothetical protein
MDTQLRLPRVNLYYMIFIIFLHLPWGSSIGNLYYMIFLYAFISRGVPQRNKAGLGFGPQKKGASTEAPL